MAIWQLTTLDVDACWARLGSAELGRFGLSIHAMPVIRPVFFLAHNGEIIFRSIRGTKFASASEGSAVAFEADGYSAETNEGWSVLVQGMSRPLSDDYSMTLGASLPLLASSSAGPSDQLTAIDVATISGRAQRRAETGAAPCASR
jgi:uncharacterized protein